jgi:hypothetical protein
VLVSFRLLHLRYVRQKDLSFLSPTLERIWKRRGKKGEGEERRMGGGEKRERKEKEREREVSNQRESSAA